MSKNTAVNITLELDNGTSLHFAVTRPNYVSFVNGVSKNSFNAMNNLLAASVTDESRPLLTELQDNPANIPELAGELIELYKPDVAVAVKKREQ